MLISGSQDTTHCYCCFQCFHKCLFFLLYYLVFDYTCIKSECESDMNIISVNTSEEKQYSNTSLMPTNCTEYVLLVSSSTFICLSVFFSAGHKCVCDSIVYLFCMYVCVHVFCCAECFVECIVFFLHICFKTTFLL